MANVTDFDKIFASNSPLQPYTWSDKDYLNGWDTVGSIPPTKQQFDALQAMSDKKAQALRAMFDDANLNIAGNAATASKLATANAEHLLVASAFAHYSRETLPAVTKTSVTLSKTLVNINGEGYALEETRTLDLTASASWDASTYATAANRAGKDFYIYACVPDSGTVPDFILSANSTVPTGYSADTSRKIGGFHCLCADVGTIDGHTLSGYVAGDILPLSIWDLRHRAVSGNEGMVYIDGIGKWVDIYLPSVSGGKLVSAYGGTIADGESTTKFNGEKFAEWAGKIGKSLIARDEFLTAMDGSNQGTSIAGSADPGTTGGHVDTASRRMISNYGIEDGCGVAWQFGRDMFEGGAYGTYDSSYKYLMGYFWVTDSVYNSDTDSSSKGSCIGLLRRVLLGANWGAGSYCGSRSAACYDFSAGGHGNDSARGVSSPRCVSL